jgi:diguanylate cyclase (GGDEF)-like protein
MSKRGQEAGRLRWFSLFAGLVIGSTLPAQVPPQTPQLSTVASVRALTAEQAAQGLPRCIRGIVTALVSYHTSFFLQDASGGIFILSDVPELKVQQGQDVEVCGVSNPGDFAPVLLPKTVRVIAAGALPAPQMVQWDDLVDGKRDSRWIAVDGVIHSAAIEPHSGSLVLVLKVEIGTGRQLLAYVSDYSGMPWQRLPGSAVRIKGVAGSVFNDKKQFLGPRLFISSVKDIAISEPGVADPFQLPLHSIDSLLSFREVKAMSDRVRVRGAVTYVQPGESFYIQDAGNGLLVQSRQTTPLSVGMVVEVAGYPANQRYSPVLADAVYRVVGSDHPSAAQPASAASMLGVDRYGFSIGPYDGRLVQLQGRLLERIPGLSDDQLLLKDGDRVFVARQPHSETGHLPLATGTLLRLTGVCAVQVDEAREEAHEARSFEILLRSPADLVVLKTVPWWNATHTGWVVAAVLLLCTIVLGIWLEQKRLSEMHALAMTDSLTGLYNRRAFFLLAEHHWQAALRRGTPLLLFFMDLDRFKEINDTLGHREGDCALQTVTEALRECFRGTDIIARMGGDEFAVLFEAKGESSEIIGQRFNAAVALANRQEGRRFQLSLSIGTLICDESLAEFSMEELVARADALMYRQKEERREKASRA